MNYSDDEMTTDISQLQQPNYDTFSEHPSVPQSTMQRAPPMRFGHIDNFPTHQTIKPNYTQHPVIPQNNNYMPPIMYNKPTIEQNYTKNKQNKLGGFFENLFSGIYERLKEPVIITILFMVLAHRLTIKSINPFFPFVGENPSLDPISLAYRGFILSVIFIIIRNYL